MFSQLLTFGPSVEDLPLSFKLEYGQKLNITYMVSYLVSKTYCG